MRKFLAVSMAALTLGATIAATATPAAAQYRSGYYDRYGRWHSYRRNNDSTGAAIAGGIVGLALGAALASSNNHNRYYGNGYNSYYGNGYYNNGYYNNGYYNNGYYGDSYSRSYYGGYGDSYYGRSYRTCTSRRTVWDPYIGRYITQRFRYAC